MNQPIYKIVDREQWQSAMRAGLFAGAEIDLQDGYIHFSARHQVAETLRKHFAGRRDLLLIEVQSGDLGESLRWEVARNGDEFPHLYCALDVRQMTESYELPVDESGQHILPAGF